MSGVVTPAVAVRGLRKAFGPNVALDGFDLEVEPASMVAVLGPSGCGKTTALRVIAGFEQPDAGTVDIRGRRVASPSAVVPPERRRVGFVFQDYALFPHLSVRENIAYGVRRDPDRAVRVGELLDLVGLAQDAARMPHELSGGMQQRVALARALAPRPDVVLLDEPFSNLDQALRTQLRGEVRDILRQARQSAVFVTHDQGEALTIADKVAVMSRGRVEQCAPPEIIYAEPATPFVATFVGVANLVQASCQESMAVTRFGPVPLVGPRSRRPQGRALCVLRPEHFRVAEAADGAAGHGTWEVTARRFSGSEILLEVRAADGELMWVEAGDQVRRLSVGDRVELELRPVETVAFGPTAGVVGRPLAHPPTADDAAEVEWSEAGTVVVEPPIH
ncbi:ABC transporter ATP-binding protein [soil metagenome]